MSAAVLAAAGVALASLAWCVARVARARRIERFRARLSAEAVDAARAAIRARRGPLNSPPVNGARYAALDLKDGPSVWPGPSTPQDERR